MDLFDDEIYFLRIIDGDLKLVPSSQLKKYKKQKCQKKKKK